MKVLSVFLCLDLLVGCSSELVKPRGTPVAGPDGRYSETEAAILAESYPVDP
ncbi:MAG TPA: hypothetical protein VLA49_11505 [Anaerolineales bacterium]|nr:hypothetical protein [Anaerolineales bacterium]